MRRLELLLTLSLLSLAVTLDAQKKIVSGLIRDFHSDEPIPFASVVFKGTTTGALTDSAGRFAFFLNHWPSDTIEVTCVGYQPYHLYVDPAKDSVTVLISMERGTFNEGVKVKVRVN